MKLVLALLFSINAYAATVSEPLTHLNVGRKGMGQELTGSIRDNSRLISYRLTIPRAWPNRFLFGMNGSLWEKRYSNVDAELVLSNYGLEAEFIERTKIVRLTLAARDPLPKFSLDAGAFHLCGEGILRKTWQLCYQGPIEELNAYLAFVQEQQGEITPLTLEFETYAGLRYSLAFETILQFRDFAQVQAAPATILESCTAALLGKSTRAIVPALKILEPVRDREGAFTF